MITPQEASALKPGEVEWLRRVEGVVDRFLLEHYAGGEIWVKLPKPPHRRTLGVLLNHYGQAGWTTLVGPSMGEVVEVVFAAREAVEAPKFPGDVPPEVVKPTETAWDKLLLEE